MTMFDPRNENERSALYEGLIRGALLPLHRITTVPARCARPDLWPEDVWEEMRAIWEGDGR